MAELLFALRNIHYMLKLCQVQRITSAYPINNNTRSHSRHDTTTLSQKILDDRGMQQTLLCFAVNRLT
jgi:hypothetical protein